MPLTHHVCENCGFWQRRPGTPTGCPVCEDHRHDLPPDGFAFRTAQQVAQDVETTWTEVEPGVHRFDASERFVIGPSGYVVEHPDGNVAFEGPPWWSDAALDRIEQLGGLAWIGASHPHAYGALWRLKERFPDAEVAINVLDLQWANAVQVTWPWDDELPLARGLTLHRTAGHFPGHTVLHDAQRGILFAGDALKLDLDPDDPRTALGISCHKAFVRDVPLTPAELRGYRAVFERLDFDQVWTPFEQGANAGRDDALALVDEQLAGRPHTRFRPVARPKAPS